MTCKAFGLAVGLLLALTPVATADTITLNPVADTWVTSTSPTSSAGGASTGLTMAKAGTYEYRPYLAFDLSQVPGTVTAAQLRLRVTTAGTAPAVIRAATSPVTESMTWNTRASVDGASYWTLPSISNVPAGSDAVANVSSQAVAAGDGEYGLAVAGTSFGTNVTYASRESATPPQLVVTYDPSAAKMATTPIPSTLFTGVWRTPLSPTAALHASSATWAANLRSQMSWPSGTGTMWFGDSSCAHPTYVVPDSTPLTPVHIRNASSNGISGTDLENAVSQGVPLPAGWRPNNCSDDHVAVYQPGTGKYWEFWNMVQSDVNFGGSPSAQWGGYMLDAATNVGRFRTISGPNFTHTQWWTWGATATSLPLAAGAITREDLQSGTIAHSLNIAVGKAMCSFRLYPAQRNDCQSTTVPVPEGARFRLPADVDVDAAVAAWNPGSGLTAEQDASARRFLRMLIVAIRDYGMVVTDQTGGGISLYFRDYGIADGLVNWNDYYPRSLVAPNVFWRGIPMNLVQVVDAPSVQN